MWNKRNVCLVEEDIYLIYIIFLFFFVGSFISGWCNNNFIIIGINC